MPDVLKIKDGHSRSEPDELAVEEPLEIRVRGKPISVTMRTPGNDDELAAGFLLTEGIIHSAADLLHIEPCTANEFGNVIQVRLAPLVPVDFEKLTRHVFASSSCGLCGKVTCEAVRGNHPPVTSDARIRADILQTMPDTMRAAQATFDRTGGLHAAALFDVSGNLLCVREDVGRHNAVDKVIGRALLDGRLPLNNHVLLVSGRLSFEIIQKSIAAGVAIIAAVSAPSSLAVELAEESGQTLVGFLRPGRMNVYSHAERIDLERQAVHTT